MEFDGQFAVSLLDLVGTGVARHTKDFVWISLAHASLSMVRSTRQVDGTGA
jgi:threonine/homoserine efflux transporter RhtA